MKKISIIVAVAGDNGIGKDNKLLCHIPGDLKRFKKITSGHTVIMGKNTFLSLPGGPLKDRRNIVISDNPQDRFDGCIMVSSIKEALDHCEEDRETFIIGGASVYRQFMPYTTRLYLTRVNKCFDADTFFPEINAEEWTEISKEKHQAKEQTDFTYDYVVLERKS
ncbi:MAG: dihydrofolate reductase [Bacteroidales bacterium]|nr:dihydrofolate reductase [Bacteroidales bacterium]